MRDVVTTALEVAGMLLISAALGCVLGAWWVFFLAAGVSFTAVGVLEGRKP